MLKNCKSLSFNKFFLYEIGNKPNAGSIKKMSDLTTYNTKEKSFIPKKDKKWYIINLTINRSWVISKFPACWQIFVFCFIFLSRVIK